MGKERPILFSGEMVRAILDGRKTQTRRVIKLPKWAGAGQEYEFEIGDTPGQGQSAGDWPFAISKKTGCLAPIQCPYGERGDSLYVRETWAYLHNEDGVPVEPRKVLYAATDDWEGKRLPSIHQPRKYSRISLEVVSVRVKRLQDITEADAKAEGVDKYGEDDSDHIDNAETNGYFPVRTYVAGYENLWDQINAKRGFGWDKDPWVWVIEFKKFGGGAGEITQ